MSRLVIVSNRVADLTKRTQTGGLAVALADALKSRGGLWLGWDGKTSRDEAVETAPRLRKIGAVTMATIGMSKQEHADYYLGFANSVLWPLFHYRLDLVNFQSSFLEGYKRVNARFADALMSVVEPDDMIWVHDYHLIPLADELRRRGSGHRIGFFLHIPFPPPDVLAAAPNSRWLASSLLQYDLVGFQTQWDLENLKRYVVENLSQVVKADGCVRFKGRLVELDSFPIGIDVEAFAAMAEEPADDVQIDNLRRQILGRKQIIGVDRLDYSKGLPERMKAFGRLIEKYPKIRKAVTFMQIAPPTREGVRAYNDIRKELESLSGALNGRYADFNWTPIRYIHRNVPREKLAPLFRSSQIGFVTPLRDGMNLVAKEYVAAQDRADPGVLVLSKFAGAAEEMAEAMIVNPYDVDGMARSLYEALNMPVEERKERHEALLARIRRGDAKSWLNRFLSALERPSAAVA